MQERLHLMLDKPWEYWAAILGAMLYVATRDAETESLSRRVAKTIASALLAIGLAPGTASYVGDNEIAAAVLLMAFGTLVLDILTALILDRDLIKSIVRRRFGGDGDE